MSSAPDRFVVPDQGATVFDRYRITTHLSSDARGDCYLGEPIDEGRLVEIRFLSHPALRGATDALWQEIGDDVQRLASVDHPNVERVVCGGVAEFGNESLVCVVAELVEGETLLDRLRERRRLPTLDALVLGQRIVQGLAALHHGGVVHGDLRPNRIMLVRSAAGDAGAVVLCDVGVNNLLLNAMRDSPALIDIFGPDFLAPEQIAGEPATFATDIYAFGLVLYRMLSGGAPFAAESTRELLAAQLSLAPIALNERCADMNLPVAVEALVERCLAKAPADRFESPQALLKALRECETALGGRSFAGASSDFSQAPAANRLSRPPPSTSGPQSSSVLRGPTLLGPRYQSAGVGQPGGPAPSRTAAYAVAEIRREVSSWKRWFLVAAGFTLLCGITGGFVLASMRRAQPPAPITRAQPQVPANIHLVVRSNTPNAEVMVRGRTWPVPLRVELSPGTSPEMVEVSGPGHPPRRLWMILDSNTEAQIDLLPGEPTARPVTPSAPATPPVAATLTATVVRRVIEEHQGEVADCLNRIRVAVPALGGSVPVNIVIGPNGVVKRASWTGGAPSQIRALGCITSAVRRWTFPASNTGGDFLTTYTFSLD